MEIKSGVIGLKVNLFILLLIGCITYLLMGVYCYKIDTKSKTNKIFLRLGIIGFIWSLGYAMMLTSENLDNAFFWRGVSVFGYCYFNGLWFYYAYLLNNPNEKKYSKLVKFIVYVPTTLLFILNITVDPSTAMSKQDYGWIDLAPMLHAQIAYTIWTIIINVLGIAILFKRGIDSKKNRIKKQIKIILLTYSLSIIIGTVADFFLPTININFFHSVVLTGIIALGGVCYAINRHRMMLTTQRYVSEYIYNTVNELIFILDENFLIKNCNRASLNITEYDFEELEGKIISQFISYENLNLDTIMKNGYMKNNEVNLQKKDGSYIICELYSTVIYDEYNDILGVLILLHDISERKIISGIQKNYTLKLKETNVRLKNQIEDRIRAEEKIRHYVNYDALTELPNRKMMLENINRLLERKNKSFAIFFVDLDGFKYVNDTFGHQAGDVVLKNVASTLGNIIGSDDIICRIGGDEFVIILENFSSYTYIEEMANNIQKILEQPFVYEKEQLIVGASIGISIAPKHGRDANTLISNADLAMYQVKKNGGYSHMIYSSKMQEDIIDKLEVREKFKKALEDNEFIIHYQPIMDLKSMKIVNAEALIRRKYGDKIIPPMEFIPIAKRVGEIVSIDNWMLENACMQCEKWNEMALDEIKVSVNMSYSQLKQPKFVAYVQKILDDYSIPPQYLTLEITEDEGMKDIEVIIEVLTELKDIGIKISLDDFGIGSSSLSYVNKLPIDNIKIDRSLIMNIEKDEKNIMMIKSIINMGHSLNISITAEGIETKKQFEVLRDLGCDFIQGYIIGAPMEVSDFEHKFINIY